MTFFFWGGGGGDTKNSVAHDYVLEFYVESSSG